MILSVRTKRKKKDHWGKEATKCSGDILNLFLTGKWCRINLYKLSGIKCYAAFKIKVKPETEVLAVP